ncbi:MAG TPA: PAS domain S-box protein [Thermoanaerobaculaceae bacterium]|nr:PAS domain S-box protein [Thermoanaerobaculaceae bacterium]
MSQPVRKAKRQESAALHGEERYRRILDNMLEGCAILSPDWTYVYVNEVNARHAHLTPQQMIGRNMLDLIPGVEVSPFFEAYRRCMEERTPQQVEARFTFADGSSAWYEAKAEPVPDGIFVLSQDITQRKRMEEDLRRALAEAEEGKRTLQALMVSIPEGITIADAHGPTIRMVSQHGQELLGAPHNLPAADVARQWPVLYPNGESIMNPEDLPLTRAIRSGEVVRDVELIQVNSRGDRLPLLCNAAPIRDQRGDIIGGVVAWRDITERKKAEEALRESEARFRSVLEGSRDVIYRVDLATGRYEYISPSAEAVTGFSPEELMAMDVEAGLAMVHPVDAPVLRAAVERLEALGEAQAEYRQRTKAGEYRWLSNYMSLIRDRAGLPRYRSGAIRDITEAKRAGDALRESEILLRGFFDSPGALRGIVEVVGDDILFISVNAAAASLYGRLPEEVRGKRATELGVPGEIARLWLDSYRESQRTNQAVAFELRRPVANGEAWFSATVDYLGSGPDGHPRFGYVMFDVTGLRRTQDALRRSEEKFRQVFDAMADAIQLCELEFDSEDRAVDVIILDTNPAYERHTGLRRDQVVNRRIREILPFVEQEWLDRYETLVRTGQSIYFDQWNAGVGRWFGVSASSLGRNRFVAVFKDITGLKQAEGALRNANDQLREADRRKDEFLAILSHELRNPLAPIRNSLHLLNQAPPGGDVARRARDVLERQTDHLTRLVDDLLDMSRIARGKIQLHLARIDARDVVRRSCDDIRTVFEQHSVQLRFSQATEPVWVDADATRLAQMAGNLVSNALKFTPSGGKVGVSVETRGGACEVRVLDTGIGIAPADLDRIFDQFVSAGRTRHGGQAGMGIGLYLVRELAHQHGGSVRATSAGVGLGAEFVLTLPLAAAPPDNIGRGTTEGVISTLSVLIVEDNQDAASSLADLLALDAHEVRVAATGRAGIEEVRARAPDVLICDLGLPDVNGLEVIRSVRAAGSTVFAVALTGYAQLQDRELALAAGFDAHLAKPPRLDKLNEILNEVARKKH